VCVCVCVCVCVHMGLAREVMCANTRKNSTCSIHSSFCIYIPSRFGTSTTATSSVGSPRSPPPVQSSSRVATSVDRPSPVSSPPAPIHAPKIALSEIAPPEIAPNETAPPEIAPHERATPPEMAPPEIAPPEIAATPMGVPTTAASLIPVGGRKLGGLGGYARRLIRIPVGGDAPIPAGKRTWEIPAGRRRLGG